MDDQAIMRLIHKIENEPLAKGEPEESVQLGRLQVCDELRAILRQGKIGSLQNWVVLVRKGNYSAFNGYRFTPSEYSEVYCKTCRALGRTKAKYVDQLPDGGRTDLVDRRKTGEM